MSKSPAIRPHRKPPRSAFKPGEPNPGSATQFKPGQSGNPSGRPAGYQEMTESFRALTPKARNRLVKQLDSTDEYVAQGAAKEILARGWGKTPQPLTGEGGEGGANGLVVILPAETAE